MQWWPGSDNPVNTSGGGGAPLNVHKNTHTFANHFSMTEIMEIAEIEFGPFLPRDAMHQRY